MLKKKRFGRSTVGRIIMFFQKKPYKAYKNYCEYYNNSIILELNLLSFYKKLEHYSIVTKKKIYNTYY